jgi:hypothetical protein
MLNLLKIDEQLLANKVLLRFANRSRSKPTGCPTLIRPECEATHGFSSGSVPFSRFESREKPRGSMPLERVESVQQLHQLNQLSLDHLSNEQALASFASVLPGSDT